MLHKGCYFWNGGRQWWHANVRVRAMGQDQGGCLHQARLAVRRGKTCCPVSDFKSHKKDSIRPQAPGIHDPGLQSLASLWMDCSGDLCLLSCSTSHCSHIPSTFGPSCKPESACQPATPAESRTWLPGPSLLGCFQVVPVALALPLA